MTNENDLTITKDKRLTGRPTKLTPERQAKIVDCISKGNYLVTACRANGITKTCYLHWLERAELEENNGGGIYYDFSLAIKKAEADAETELASMIRETALEKREWLPAMTFLERRHPERWGRKDRSTIQIEETKQIIITTVEVVKDYGNRVIEGEGKELPEGVKEE